MLFKKCRQFFFLLLVTDLQTYRVTELRSYGVTEFIVGLALVK